MPRKKSIDLTNPNWQQNYYGNSSYNLEDDDDDEDTRGDKGMSIDEFAQLGRQNRRSIIQKELYDEADAVTISYVREDPRTGLPIQVGTRTVRGGAEVIDSPEALYSAPAVQPDYPQQNYPQPNYYQPNYYQQYYPQMNPMMNPMPMPQPQMMPQMMPQQMMPQQMMPQQMMPQQQMMPPQQMMQSQPEPPNGFDQMLHDIGLNFLSLRPQPPSIPIKVCFSGPIRFATQIACHEFVITDQTVVIIVDKRQRGSLSMDFDIETPDIQMALLMPDQRKIDVIAMVPQTLSFDIGPLRCFLFFRKDNEETPPEPVQQPVYQPVQQPVQQPVYQPVQQPVYQPVQQPVYQPVQQPVQQPIPQQPIYQWPGQPPGLYPSQSFSPIPQPTPPLEFIPNTPPSSHIIDTDEKESVIEGWLNFRNR
jgi:hypothetical protein